MTTACNHNTRNNNQEQETKTMTRHNAILIALTAMLATLSSSTHAAFTWTEAVNERWDTNAAYTNWDGGAGNVPWTQGEDAIFDGEPTTQVEVSGGGMQFNTLTVQNIADGSMTIDRISGNDADHLIAVGLATFNVPTGTTLSVPRIAGTVGITVDGGGIVIPTRTPTFSGGINIVEGTFQRLPSSSFGTVSLLDTSGGGEARLFIRGSNSSWSVSNDIVVQAGGTGTAVVHNSPTSGGGYAPALSGTMTLGRDLTVRYGRQTADMILSGTIIGSGDLILEGEGSYVQKATVTGDASAHTGAIRMVTNTSNKDLQLDGTLGNSNITVGNGVDILGSGTLMYNVSNDTADLITIGTGGTADFTGMTLQPVLSGTQSLDEYVLVNTTTGVTGPFASIVNYGYYTFTVDYDGTALNQGAVVLTVAIPEPASAVLLGLAGLAILRRRR